MYCSFYYIISIFAGFFIKELKKVNSTTASCRVVPVFEIICWD